MLADFDEGGFFDRVLIAFPFARTSSEATVSERVFVRDIGPDWLPLARFRAIRRLAAPAHVVKAVCALARVIRRERLDIVRATDPCFAGLIGWCAARLTGRPLCVSIHADWDKRHALGGASSGATLFGSRRPAKAIERFVLSRAELVMPIRESLRAYALQSGAAPSRIRIIPHGADLGPFIEPSTLSVAERFGLVRGRSIISFVGRLVRENYIDDVVALAQRLVALRDDFVLLVVGGGSEETRLAALLSRDAALNRVIKLAGFQPREVVAAVRQQSAVSLCLMGGFSLIEACASGSAVVSYDVEWHRELVRDGETGYLVDEHDVDGLSRAVNRLLDRTEERTRLGRNARVLAMGRHSLDASARVKQECYREILDGAALVS